MAPEICGVAMDLPLAVVYALSPVLVAERVPVDWTAAAKPSNGVGTSS